MVLRAIVAYLYGVPVLTCPTRASLFSKEHKKIPARQRISTAVMSVWGGLWTRFEYIGAMDINMNGTSIALYRRRLCAFFLYGEAPSAQRDGHVPRASFADDRTFAR